MIVFVAGCHCICRVEVSLLTAACVELRESCADVEFRAAKLMEWSNSSKFEPHKSTIHHHDDYSFASLRILVSGTYKKEYNYMCDAIPSFTFGLLPYIF